MLTPGDAETFERCIAVGGVAVFPADTVYGLACEPDTDDAVRRLYALKGRPPDKPSAIMFFSTSLALAALPELGPHTRSAVEALLPGGLTLLVPNPERRFPLASAPGGVGDVLGVRVPALPPALDALHAVRWPVLQSSANLSGGPDAREIGEVPERLRREADLVLDGGPLPGTPSTVVDLRAFEDTRAWSVVREGAVAPDAVRDALQGL